MEREPKDKKRKRKWNERQRKYLNRRNRGNIGAIEALNAIKCRKKVPQQCFVWASSCVKGCFVHISIGKYVHSFEPRNKIYELP